MKCPKCKSELGVFPNYIKNRKAKKYRHYKCLDGDCGHQWKERKRDWKREYYG